MKKSAIYVKMYRNVDKTSWRHDKYIVSIICFAFATMGLSVQYHIEGKQQYYVNITLVAS